MTLQIQLSEYASYYQMWACGIPAAPAVIRLMRIFVHNKPFGRIKMHFSLTRGERISEDGWALGAETRTEVSQRPAECSSAKICTRGPPPFSAFIPACASQGA